MIIFKIGKDKTLLVRILECLKSMKRLAETRCHVSKLQFQGINTVFYQLFLDLEMYGDGIGGVVFNAIQITKLIY